MNSLYGTRDSFFQAGGTLDPDSPSYIVRKADQELLGLVSSDEYCNVLAACQTGKSSLIVQAQRRLRDQDVRSIVIDLKTIGDSNVQADGWYYAVIRQISQKLNLDMEASRWWAERQQLGPQQRFNEFLQEVLDRIPGQIVIFIDEIDSVLHLKFTDDFFVAIRALFNERANKPDNRRLTFVLTGVARPGDLIKDRRRTPYNIGRTIGLEDFDAQSAKKLLPGIEKVCPNQAEPVLERVLYWTGGHPYLTQKICAQVVSEGEGVWSDRRIDRLVDRLFFQEGQVLREPNLQRVDEYIQNSEHRQGILQIYRKVLSGREVRDDEQSIEKSQLKLSGLAKVTPAKTLQIRNRIYGRVFGPDWITAPGSRQTAWWVWGVLALVLVVGLLIAGPRVYRQLFAPVPTITPTTTIFATTTPVPTIPVPTTPAATTPAPTTPVPTTPVATIPAPTTPVPTTPVATTPAPTTPVPTTPVATTPAPTTPVPTTPVATTPAPTTPVPTGVLVVPQQGACITLRWASVYDRPGPIEELTELGAIGPGERVKAIGYAMEPWTNWIKVHRDQDQLEGFVWKPFLDCQPGPPWPQLEIVQVSPNAFCDSEGEKQAGLVVKVQGGDGSYSFFWAGQQVEALKLEQRGEYRVFWPWGRAPNVGEIVVKSGDGQSASSGQFIEEPVCPK